jgi:flavorubredoxin
MTIVRDAGKLTLINSVRLDDAGLARLDALGRVTHLVKIGSLHGHDDAFYKSRYKATYWALPGMQHAHGFKADKELRAGGELPFAGASLFVFETTKMPECILRIDREGGIAVACDALQNWVAPDDFFSDESRKTMTKMGFFQSANVGPVWMQVNEPKAQDFKRLLAFPFRHALCGHGVPLRDRAAEAFGKRFQPLSQA